MTSWPLATSRRDRLVSVTLAGLVASAVFALASPAWAQPEPRQRPYNGVFGGGPPVDPNRSRSDLTLSGSFFAGYDDAVVATAPGLGGSAGSDETGNLQGNVGIEYRRGRPIRHFTVDGNLYVAGYGEAGVSTLTGGSVGFSGVTRVGRANNFTVNAGLGYFPVFSIGPTAQIEAPVVDVDTLPPPDLAAQGVFERASLQPHAAVSYSHSLARRTSIDFGYDFGAVQYEAGPDPTSAPGDNTSHHASVALDQELSRTVSFIGRYDMSYQRPTQIDGTRPITDHSAHLGFSWTKRVSRTRTLHIAASGGARHVESTFGTGVGRTPFDYTVPSADAQVGLDLGRNWNVSADYRRSVTVTPEVTSETFLTDGVIISARGLMGPRVQLLLSVGRDWSDTSDIGGIAQLDATNANVQTQIAITRLIAATVTYSYFTYLYEDVTDLPVGFAPQTERNAIRGGITIRLPLIGRYEGERGTAPAGRP